MRCGACRPTSPPRVRSVSSASLIRPGGGHIRRQCLRKERHRPIQSPARCGEESMKLDGVTGSVRPSMLKPPEACSRRARHGKVPCRKQRNVTLLSFKQDTDCNNRHESGRHVAACRNVRMSEVRCFARTGKRRWPNHARPPMSAAIRHRRLYNNRQTIVPNCHADRAGLCNNAENHKNIFK